MAVNGELRIENFMRSIASFVLKMTFLGTSLLLSSCTRWLQTEGRIYPVLASPTKAKAGGVAAGIGVNTRIEEPNGITYAPTFTAQGLFFYTLNSWLFTEGSLGFGAGKSKETSGYSATASPGIGVYHTTGRFQWLASFGPSSYSEDNSVIFKFTDQNGSPSGDLKQTLKQRYVDLYLKLGMKIRLDAGNRFRLLAGLYTLKNIDAKSKIISPFSNSPDSISVPNSTNTYLLGQPNSILLKVCLV